MLYQHKDTNIMTSPNFNRDLWEEAVDWDDDWETEQTEESKPKIWLILVSFILIFLLLYPFFRPLLSELYHPSPNLPPLPTPTVIIDSLQTT